MCNEFRFFLVNIFSFLLSYMEMQNMQILVVWDAFEILQLILPFNVCFLSKFF